MPPAIFVAAAAGTTGADSFSFLTPSTARARDSLIAIVATAPSNVGPDLSELALEGWGLLSDHTVGSSRIWILRREAKAGDLASIEIPMVDSLSWGISALVVMRNLDNVQAAIGASAVAVTSSTTFAAPSRTLATYSDLFIGIALVTSAAVAVAPPGDGVERIEVQDGGRTLEVFTILPEATGATGAKNATTAGAQSGLAVSLALQADHLKGFGLNFAFDPPGAIGLPAEGV